MVAPVLCEHCHAEAKHPVTKAFDGRVLNFCCNGCLSVYEFLREEGLLEQVRKEEEADRKARRGK